MMMLYFIEDGVFAHSLVISKGEEYNGKDWGAINQLIITNSNTSNCFSFMKEMWFINRIIYTFL